MDTKTCSRCGETLPRDLSHFMAHDRTRDGLRSRCRRCATEIGKARYREKVGREVRSYETRGPGCRTSYMGADPERGRRVRKAERADKRAMIAERVRKRVASVLARKYALRRQVVWLGCSPEELRRHIERQFAPGMSWQNRSHWHVDHVRPLASFDLSDREQRAAACHFTNLQPLWAADNLAKAARV